MVKMELMEDVLNMVDVVHLGRLGSSVHWNAVLSCEKS